MGFTEVLTILFIALKLLGVIEWSWVAVLAPELIMLVVYVVIFIAALFGVGATGSRIRRDFDTYHDFDDFDF